MSNDHTDWINELKEAFMQDGWQRVVMSRDLKLNPQQLDVSVAVDMEIGRSSAVFIGNGVRKFIFFVFNLLFIYFFATVVIFHEQRSP
jgi:hypothetical protein